MVRKTEDYPPMDKVLLDAACSNLGAASFECLWGCRGGRGILPTRCYPIDRHWWRMWVECPECGRRFTVFNHDTYASNGWRVRVRRVRAGWVSNPPA